MEEHFPVLLSRKKAMQFTGLSRKMLEKFAKGNGIRFFTTNGGHKRYFKPDLTKKLNENI
jgi:hypothetical protein